VYDWRDDAWVIETSSSSAVLSAADTSWSTWLADLFRQLHFEVRINPGAHGEAQAD
jgi:hypothetical protein